MEERKSYIDVLRILAIFSVILLHCNTNFFPIASLYPQREWLLANCINAISRFGVPIFFMISGYLLLSEDSSNNIGKFYKKRLLRILPPFFIWNMVYYVILCIKGQARPFPYDFFLRMMHQSISYHFWFVYMIISFYIFTPFFKKMILNCTQKQLWLLLFMILLPTTIFPLLNKIIGVWFFTFSPIIEGYFGYFLLGYLLGHFNFPKKYQYIFYIVALICIPIVILGTYYGSTTEKIDTFFNGGYQFNSYFIASAIFLFVKYNMPKIKYTKTVELLTLLGNLSFGLYLCHVLIIEKLHTILTGLQANVEIFSYTFITFFGGYFLLILLYQIKPLRRLLF